MSTVYQLPYGNLTDIKLNPNEFVNNVTANRALDHLFANDEYLLSLIQELSGEMAAYKAQLEAEMLALSGTILTDIHNFETSINNYLDTELPLLENGVIPIGASILWPLAINCPSHFSFDDGGSLSRASYPTLFNLLGSTFGEPDGSSFNKPTYPGILNYALISNSLSCETYARGDDNNAQSKVSTTASGINLLAKVWGSDSDGGDFAFAKLKIDTAITSGNKLHIDYMYTIDHTLTGSYLQSTFVGIFNHGTGVGTTQGPLYYGTGDFYTNVWSNITGNLSTGYVYPANSGVWQSYTSPALYGTYIYDIFLGFGGNPHMIHSGLTSLTLNLYISNISIISSTGDTVLTIYSPSVATTLGVPNKSWSYSTTGPGDTNIWNGVSNGSGAFVSMYTSNLVGSTSYFALRTD